MENLWLANKDLLATLQENWELDGVFREFHVTIDVVPHWLFITDELSRDHRSIKCTIVEIDMFGIFHLQTEVGSGVDFTVKRGTMIVISVNKSHTR